MTILVQFAWQYDLDFCALYADETFDLAGAIKGALKAWACRDISYRIAVPASTGLDLTGRPMKLHNCHVSITLNDREDAFLIEMLGRIWPGHRNGFIKNLTRRYFSSMVETPYFSSSMFEVPTRVRQKKYGMAPANKGKILHPELNIFYDPADPDDLDRVRKLLEEKRRKVPSVSAVQKAREPEQIPVQKAEAPTGASGPEPSGFDLFESINQMMGVL